MPSPAAASRLPTIDDTGGRRLDPCAVVDIGSNSVRLVVYDGRGRVPLPIFNEKLLCGLGKELDTTGALAPDGVERALAALPRFAEILDSMGVAQVDYLATAAVREATDGAEFVARAEDLCRHNIRVLSGTEEARLSGLGVLSGTPQADGVMADLGGGSVELVELSDGRTGRQATLPLGPLRQDLKVIQNPAKARGEIDRQLRSVDWLNDVRGKRFYVVGGAWRTFARIHMVHIDSPLHIIHQYAIPSTRALDFAEFIGKLSPLTLQKVHGVSKRRVDTLPYASILLARLMRELDPQELVFSAYGLREGALFDRLDPTIRAEDPLLAACRDIAEVERTSGAAVDGDALHRWLAPAFPDEAPEEERLRHAACLLADIARWEHPDYRAEHALVRVMRLPIVGIDHAGRAFLGMAVAARHAQIDNEVPALKTVTTLIENDKIDRARAIGLGIRLAYTLSGGMRDLLFQFSLKRENGTIRLVPPSNDSYMTGEAVERRFGSLARVLKLEPSIG